MNNSEVSPLGLRERKLQRTRAELIDAAVTLCLSVGYDNATVDSIANAADVSARTFSRYFASKDAVFMAVLESVEEVTVAEIAAQPAGLGYLEALRAANEAVFTRIADRPYGQPSADQVALMLRVVNSSDVLRQKAMEYRNVGAVEVLAERAGVATDDAELQLAVALFNVTLVTACARLVAETPPELLGPRVMVERMNEAFGHVAAFTSGLDPKLHHQTRTQSTSMSAG